MMIAAGILLPFVGTALGAASVFFMRRQDKTVCQGMLLGAAAGIMTAASVFSLLLPALEQGGPWIAAAGFLPGMLFPAGADRLARPLGRTMDKTDKMIWAVTVHNLPEGMAVGVGFAGFLKTGSDAALAGAFALSLGIALQNIPEGAIISMPLRATGMGRGRSFALGVLSGAVEPVGAALILVAAGVLSPLLPLLLSFAAGAMIAVTAEELLPDLARQGAPGGGSLWVALGFLLMMLMDVCLG